MKKILSLILCLGFILSLVACGGTMDKVTNDAQSMGESIVSGTESATDRVVSGAESIADSTKNAVEGKDNSMNLMAGITANDARDAALKHAGLTESQARDVDVDLDRDNGRLIYEVDFNSGNTEYDYDIDAETGEIISYDKSKD